jgi:hypothetical protein
MRTSVENGTPGPKPDIPLPWEVFYEFGHMIFVGCVVTFGPRRAFDGTGRAENTLIPEQVRPNWRQSTMADLVHKIAIIDGPERPAPS